jgi:hypothetical protein
LTITPRSPSISSAAMIRSAASRMTLNVPIKLTVTTRENRSSGNGPFLPTVRAAGPMPAQLTAMRRVPSSPARSRASVTSSGEVTSPALNRAASPSSLATSAPDDEGRSSSTTLPPPVTIRRAVASPRPDAPPVTSATESASCIARTLASARPVPAGDQRDGVYARTSATLHQLPLLPVSVTRTYRTGDPSRAMLVSWPVPLPAPPAVQCAPSTLVSTVYERG